MEDNDKYILYKQPIGLNNQDKVDARISALEGRFH